MATMTGNLYNNFTVMFMYFSWLPNIFALGLAYLYTELASDWWSCELK